MTLASTAPLPKGGGDGCQPGGRQCATGSPRAARSALRWARRGRGTVAGQPAAYGGHHAANAVLRRPLPSAQTPTAPPHSRAARLIACGNLVHDAAEVDHRQAEDGCGTQAHASPTPAGSHHQAGLSEHGTWRGRVQVWRAPVVVDEDRQRRQRRRHTTPAFPRSGCRSWRPTSNAWTSLTRLCWRWDDLTFTADFTDAGPANRAHLACPLQPLQLPPVKRARAGVGCR